MRFVKITIAFVASAIVGAVCFLVILATSDGVSFRSLKAYVILSGSMEPEVPLGSIIVVRPTLLYFPGDIVSFNPDPKNKMTVTHRITQKYDTGIYNSGLYETKGDANNAVDLASVKQDQIVGKVFLTVPYIGYAAQAAKTKKGFIFLIIVPSTIIIYEELRTLKRELANLLKKLKSSKANGRALVFVPMIASIFVFTSYSRAFFSDKETSSNNSFQAGSWATPASPVAGSVIINEVMWMGSTVSDSDEWLELRNMTGDPIDLSNWQITKWVAGTHEELMLTIPSGKTIPANGYFLISDFTKGASAINVEPDLVDSGVVLANDNLRIKIYKSLWTDSANLIDTADDGSGTPMAGSHGANEQSMERNNDPATGWYTCTNSACNDMAYWDTEGSNYGTPKAPNL